MSARENDRKNQHKDADSLSPEQWRLALEAHARRTKPTVAQLLERAESEGRMLFQPRCGVGGHAEMRGLLQDLERLAAPDVLSLTIDSYTRLKRFGQAESVLASAPERLNGYPLVAHGHERVRELEASVSAPLEIRHGSPDARRLFNESIAGGITSFEGGGIGYNLPYCKDVPLADSLRAWNEVDLACGRLAREGIVIDRELFGTLSAVLMPPSTSLALTTLEALLAARAGVRCLSISYPQGGNVIQDVAALTAIRRLAAEYLPPEVKVYPVLHEFMGAFPRDVREADSLILYGSLTARLGRATKIITKTRHEAHGIPSSEVNAEGIRTARLIASRLFDFVRLDEARVEEEAHWILRETREILEPVLQQGGELIDAIAAGFESGRLDAPFCTSRFAASRVLPARDRQGAIRYHDCGGLALSPASLRRNRRRLAQEFPSDVARKITRDIFYFSAGHFAQAPSN